MNTYVSQGNFAIGTGEDSVLQTVLGSCVSCCLHDPVSRLGGMNHMVLPDAKSSTGLLAGQDTVNDMEMLINALLKQGAVRSKLTAKVFGGAKMLSSGASIGESNSTFVLDFLRAERIPVVSRSLGGDKARRLRFWPATGAVRQKFVEDTMAQEPLRPVPKSKPALSELELF